MESKEMAKNLNKLIQLDIDAVHAYEQALKNIDAPAIKGRISEYRDDHQRHIQDLSALVRTLGETPPEYSPDFKGFIIQGFTALRSAMGTEGALKAMETNEKLTNRNYSDAIGWDLTLDAKNAVTKNYEDERRHLEYIQQALKDRLWEK